jgi:hypothetical protein
MEWIDKKMRQFRHFSELPHSHIIQRRIKGNGCHLFAFRHCYPVHGQGPILGCRADGAGIAHHP